MSNAEKQEKFPIGGYVELTGGYGGHKPGAIAKILKNADYWDRLTIDLDFEDRNEKCNIYVDRVKFIGMVHPDDIVKEPVINDSYEIY